MIHEFAIDPTLMNNFDRVARFMEACGPGMPRLIAHMPSDWLRLAIRSCAASGLGVMALKKVEIIVESAIKKRRFLSRGRTYDGAASWVECAMREHRRLPFRAVVSGYESDPRPGCLGVDADLSENDAWHPQMSVTVDRSTAGLVGAIAPMLRLSRQVILIEPHFDIGRRAFTEPIRALLRAASSQPPRLEEVHLHMANRSNGFYAFLKSNHLVDLEQMVPAGVTARVYLWETDVIPSGPNARDALHDRFLITDIGGVQIGWGFDVRPGSKTTISLLDDLTRRELEASVSPDGRRFKAACSKPLSFTGSAHY